MDSRTKAASVIVAVAAVFACCVLTVGGSDSSCADTEYSFYLDNTVEGENSEINGWYHATGTSVVGAFVSALDAAGIAYTGFSAEDEAIAFSSVAYISDWSAEWSPDGDRFGAQWAVWNYNAEEGWHLGGQFGKDADTVYYISHEIFLDIDGDSAVAAGVDNSGAWADPKDYDIGYDGTKGYASLKQAVISYYRNCLSAESPGEYGLFLEDGSEYGDFDIAFLDWMTTYDQEAYAVPSGWTAPYPDYGYLQMAPQDIMADPDHLAFGPVVEVGDVDTLEKLNGTPRALRIAADMEITSPMTLMNSISVAGNLEIGADVTLSAGYTFTVAEGATVSLESGTFTNEGKVVNNGTFEVKKGNIAVGDTGSFEGEDIEFLPYFDEGDTVEFICGMGWVVHGDDADTALYYPDRKVTATYTIKSGPTGPGDWEDCGTAELTSVAFEDSAVVMYVPSYVIGMAKIGDEYVCTFYKVEAISDEAKSAINGREISIYLPSALRDQEFGENVTAVPINLYFDDEENTVYYWVDETAPINQDGFMTYLLYADAAEPDAGFVEQGTVISVDFAEGKTAYGTRTVKWAQNDMVSNCFVVCGSSADMIATYVEPKAVHSIKFDTAGGSEVSPIYGVAGQSVEAPEEPVKDGYVFKCWYPELPSAMPDGDITVTAQWADPVTITFYLDNSVEDEKSTINGWYSGTGFSVVDAFAKALDAAGIEYTGFSPSDRKIDFSSVCINGWKSEWSPDGNLFGANWAIWSYDPDKGWYLGDMFGYESDIVVYYISREVYLDIDGQAASDVGVDNSGAWADPADFGIGCDGTKGYDSAKQALISFLRNTPGSGKPEDYGLYYDDSKGCSYKDFSEAFTAWLGTFNDEAYSVPAGWTVVDFKKGYMQLAPQDITADPDHLAFGPTVDVKDFETLKALNGTPRALNIAADMDIAEPITLNSSIIVSETLNIMADVTLSVGYTFTVAEGATVLLESGTFTNAGKIVNNGTFELRKGSLVNADEESFGENDPQFLPYYDVGEWASFISGEGSVVHGEESDTAEYIEATKVTAVYTIDSVPYGTSDWENFGTATLTSAKFGPDSTVMYVPSYIIGVVKAGSEGNYTYFYTYYKVTSVSADVLEEAYGLKVTVYLPEVVWKSIYPEKPLTQSATYVDGNGNSVTYNVDETAPIGADGCPVYTLFTDPDYDVRYVEQGTVTSVKFAAGQTDYGIKTVKWSADGHELISPDGIVCGPADSVRMIAAHVEHTAVRSITFDSAGGSEVAKAYYVIGDEVTAPEDPVWYGYDFDGWKDLPSVMQDEDITVIAQWKAKEITVTFLDGENVYAEVTETYGKSYILPLEDPVKDGYKFMGWFTKKGNETVQITDKLTVDTEVPFSANAKWIVVVSPDSDGKASFDVSGGVHEFIPSEGTKSLRIKAGDGIYITVPDASDLCGKVVTAFGEPISNTTGVKGDAYSIVLTADGEGYCKEIWITLPYKGDGSPVAYFWNGTDKEKMTEVSHEDGSVTFRTYHNSDYVVGTIESYDYAIPIIVAVIALVCLIGVLAVRRYGV